MDARLGRRLFTGAVVVAAAGLTAAGCGSTGTSPGARPTTTSTSTTSASTVRAGTSRPPSHLVERPVGRLVDPVQDAAAAVVPGGLVLAGGLTASDVSTSAVVRVRGARTAAIATLPSALHDAAAARLGGNVYVLGGGDGVKQLDGILRIQGRGATVAGRLPLPSSDQAAAVVGSTAYVVGGYTGSRWLDTVVAWRPGTAAKVVAHLPLALRYAAVAAAGGKLVVAGGSTEAGTASRQVFVFDPVRGRVSRVGLLPLPTTHAAAAGVDGVVYVVGGRGATIGTPSDAIVAVSLRTRTVRVVGRLRSPRSDLAAVAVGGTVLLAGGHGPGGTVDTLSKLVPATALPHTHYAVPALLSPHDVYAADRPGMLRGAARFALPRVYVPNSRGGTVDVINPATRRVVGRFTVGAVPQHVVPSYDLRHLYVTNDLGNSLTEIDPRTARPVRTIRVDDPYNMYFTPDGSAAIVVAERLGRLDLRDPTTFALQQSVPVPCRGVDHMDFTADGRKALVSCEFSGQLLELDVVHRGVLRTISVGGGHGMPQDVKLSPDGRVFYVADLVANGLWVVDAKSFRVTGSIATGKDAHGLYPSRDSRFLYVSNRGDGTVSVVDFRTRRVVHRWVIPGGGSPDMGGVSADGKVLWLAGRYDDVVYAISTVTGKLLAKIPVGAGPHGLCVWPQPGRYSLGHTGILR